MPVFITCISLALQRGWLKLPVGSDPPPVLEEYLGQRNLVKTKTMLRKSIQFKPLNFTAKEGSLGLFNMQEKAQSITASASNCSHIT